MQTPPRERAGAQMTEIAEVDSSGGEGKRDKSAYGNASFGDTLRRFAVPLSIFGVALAGVAFWKGSAPQGFWREHGGT